MTKEEYEDFALRYKGCGACFPMYHTLSRYEKMWFSAIQKDVAELDCQKNRNKACYSCANATERCFRNEIACPCQNYKSYKDENAELKCFIRDLIFENRSLCFQFSNTTCLFNSDYRNRAEELIGEKL